jgi:hypothetical protein
MVCNCHEWLCEQAFEDKSNYVFATGLKSEWRLMLS